MSSTTIYTLTICDSNLDVVKNYVYLFHSHAKKHMEDILAVDHDYIDKVIRRDDSINTFLYKDGIKRTFQISEHTL